MKNLHIFLLEVSLGIGLIIYGITNLLSSGSWLTSFIALCYMVSVVRSYRKISKSNSWNEKFSFMKGYGYKDIDL